MDMSVIAIAALASVSAAAVFYALVYPLLSGEKRAEKRIGMVAAAPGTQRKAQDRAAEVAGRRKQVSDSLKELEEREKGKQKVTLEDRLKQAGLTWTKTHFFIFSVIMAVLSAAAALYFTGNMLVVFFAFIAGGLGLPNWWLKRQRTKRMNKFIEEFPNAIDVIVRGIKSGLPLGDCLRIIAVEAREPVKSEFKAIVEAQTMGLSVGDACARMYERMPVQEANFFGIVIQIQQKAGGNLSEALGNLSRVLRERRKMKGKISAMSMEAKASAVIIGAMPFVVTFMLYLVAKPYITLLFTKTVGQIVIFACLFWMGIGMVMMKKMINFDM
jgi:tight adherence protein B